MPISPINRRDVTRSPGSVHEALLILSRHQVRRRQLVPTVTVIAGTNDAPARLLRQWAEGEKRTVRELSNIEHADAVSSWFAALVESRNVTTAAYAWLAGRAGCEVSDLRGLPTRSPHERTMFLDVALGTKSVPPADAVCRAVIEQSCQNDSTTQGLWPRLLDACTGDLPRAVAGVIALVGEDGGPILHAATRSGDVGSLRSILGEVTSLVSVVPTLPIIVTTTPEGLEEYLRSTPECRSLALVREGMIWLADVDETMATATTPTIRLALAAQQAAASDRWEPPPEILPLTANQDQHVGSAANADLPATDMSPTEPRANDDPARSAAERYLYERLLAHPETTGLFELNGCLKMGGRSCEVDLLARGPRVAIEIDGFYHFTDLDAYRRDRRKDVLLQHAGYFVIRCLADDVASRLEEILETIVNAVRREGIRAGEGRGGVAR